MADITVRTIGYICPHCLAKRDCGPLSFPVDCIRIL